MLAWVFGVLVGIPLVLHIAVTLGTRIEPPEVVDVEMEVEREGEVLTAGRGYAYKRGGIWLVRLDGTPTEIGYQHGRLLYEPMVENEGILLGDFEKHVPLAPARWLLTDIARFAFRDVDEGFAERRRIEIAAQARAFSPDPYEDFLPTYHRFVFLQSLYDISLSFEHSPLIGCSSFAAAGDDVENGHALFARNFDFEAGEVFDRGKAVFLVFEQDRIPYASVSWPGLVGAVTGVNREGLALAIHGGRAKETNPGGEPVVHTMREVLATASTVTEAIAALEQAEAMVSHIVIVADAEGDAAVVERAPHTVAHVRRNDGPLALTNHFEGPLASDPKNLVVEDTTSTHARRKRLDELLAEHRGSLSVEDALAILRDKEGPGGEARPLGHRETLDALIATHSVVIDQTDRVLWVSEGPHLVGRYLRFDLEALLDPAHEPMPEAELLHLPSDAILQDGRFEAWKDAGAPHAGVE